MSFSNIAQATAEDCAIVANLKTANSTLTKKVTLYSNHLSTKDEDNVALQTAMKNLQGEIKNLKAKVSTLKRSGQSGGASATKHKRLIPDPKWKREVQAHHPTWWSTPYFWSHGVGGNQYQNLIARIQATRPR